MASLAEQGKLRKPHPHLVKNVFGLVATTAAVTAVALGLRLMDVRGSNAVANQPPIPQDAPRPKDSLNPNDPTSSVYRGYHAEIEKIGNSNGTLRLDGKIPYLPEFDALNGYTIRLLPIEGPEGNFANLGDGKGVMRVGQVVSATGEIAGKVNVFYINDSVTARTGEQSFAEGIISIGK